MSALTLRLAPGMTLLDLGCGRGLAWAATDRGARVTGIDLDPAAVARAAAEMLEGVSVVGDAQEPPSGPFDVVAADPWQGRTLSPDPEKWLANQPRAATLAGLVQQLHQFRIHYNTVRPHRALDRRTPAGELRRPAQGHRHGRPPRGRPLPGPP